LSVVGGIRPEHASLGFTDLRRRTCRHGGGIIDRTWAPYLGPRGSRRLDPIRLQRCWLCKLDDELPADALAGC